MHLVTAATVQAATIERIDDTHANAKQRWLKMGAPEYLRQAEIGELHAASVLRAEPYDVISDDTGIHVQIELPRNSVVAVTISFADDLP